MHLLDEGAGKFNSKEFQEQLERTQRVIGFLGIKGLAAGQFESAEKRPEKRARAATTSNNTAPL